MAVAQAPTPHGLLVVQPEASIRRTATIAAPLARLTATKYSSRVVSPHGTDMAWAMYAQEVDSSATDPKAKRCTLTRPASDPNVASGGVRASLSPPGYK